MTTTDPAAHLLPQRRDLMARWEQGHAVDAELAELDAQIVGLRLAERVADRHGDVWTPGDDGLMHTPETQPFPLEHVEKKWGPLHRVADQITWTGRNTRDCAAFVNATAGATDTEAWFVTKARSAPTGGQGWRYVRANRASVTRWPDDVNAAVYDPRQGAWLPLRPGDTIRRAGTGFDVITESTG